MNRAATTPSQRSTLSESRLRIAVVGLGIGGATAALLLHRAGHDVVVLERAADPRPVGAGFWLQESGQLIVGQLGLLDELTAASATLNRIRITTGRRSLITLDYREMAGRLPALGVNRGTLFDLLYRTVVAEAIPVELDAEVTGVRPSSSGTTVLTTAGTWGGFDLVVAADGRNSAVREALGLTRFRHDYGWGALWAVLDADTVVRDELLQVLNGTREYAGLLPTGRGQASIFWSVRWDDQRSRVLADDLDAWRARAGRLLPDHRALLDSVEGLIEAHYSHVVVRALSRHSVERGREQACVLVGDAAHAMSPQMGVGASLALRDAWSLAGALSSSDSLAEAVDRHRRARRSQVDWYALGSAAMMPIFQSRLDAVGLARDALAPLVTRSRAIRRLMVSQVLGDRTGPFTSLPPPDDVG